MFIMYKSVNKTTKGEQALLLRHPAGKVRATMSTKPVQTKVVEFVWYGRKRIKTDQLINVSESNKQILEYTEMSLT